MDWIKKLISNKVALISIIAGAVVLVGVVGGVIFITPNDSGDGATTTTTEPPHVHTEVIDSAVSATCTATGLTEGKHCLGCGEVILAQQTVAMLSHTEEVIPAVEATCIETGLTEGKKCSVCEVVIIAQEEIPMLSHVFDEEYDRFCNVCNYERQINCRHDIPEKIETVSAIAPTCQKIGLTDGKKCSICDTMVVPQTVLETIDCIESDWIVDLEATHTEDGKKHTECTMCGALFQQQAIPSGNKLLTYTLLDNNTYKVSGIGRCKDKDIIIPSEYYGLPVTSIGEDAFYNCDSLTSVTIPDSVTSIGDSAFGGCDSLTSIIIPDSVTSIGERAFCYCTSLTSINVDDNNQCYKSVDGNLYAKNGKTLIYCTTGILESSFVIPDFVTNIGSGAFIGCDSLRNLTIPTSVTNFDECAFSDSGFALMYGANIRNVYYEGNLEDWLKINFENDTSNPLYRGGDLYFNNEIVTKVDIPNYVTIIGDYTFNGCTSLITIIIPSSVEAIGNSAFKGCKFLVEICNKSNLNISPQTGDNGYIGYHAKHIINDESQSAIKCIGDFIFFDNGEDVCLLKYVGNETEITLPEYINGDNYRIEDAAFFDNDKIISVVIPDYVIDIGISAFSSCDSLTTVMIGNSVVSIRDSAFQNCSSLTSILIPDSVTKLGKKVFHGCSALKEVYLGNGITELPSDYTTASGVFANCTSLETITIPSSVTSISYSTFYGCTSLTNVVIPESVKYIDYWVFDGCRSLTSITIPAGVSHINERAFYACTSLTSISFLGTVEQWNAIKKGKDWNLYTDLYSIYCTDGEIAKDGTVTYK